MLFIHNLYKYIIISNDLRFQKLNIGNCVSDCFKTSLKYCLTLR